MLFLNSKKMVKTIKLESGDIIIINWNCLGHLAGWIESLHAISKNLPQCGALSALVLDAKDKIFVHGGFVSPGVHAPVSRGMGENFYNQYPGTQEVQTTHFICGIIKKALLQKMKLPEKIGENPFIDADFCLEAQKLGFKIYATADLSVQFSGPASLNESQEEYAKNFAENYQRFNKKWGAHFDNLYSLPVMFHTTIAQPTGFACAARGYIKGLTENFVKVAYNFLRGTNDEEGDCDDEIINSICEYHGHLKMPQVIWGQAPYLYKNSGAHKIGFCEFEGEALPHEWIEPLNMMDEIWVPSIWDREKFRLGGVNIPIYVFSQGIDKNYFHPNASRADFKIPQKFKFLCNAAWDPRKNLPALILAFKNEFTEEEDVCLIIETINTGLVQEIGDEVKKVKGPKNGGMVYVREDLLTREELPTIYTACDCFVFPTHGEAWGLPLFEALACGLPVITTDWGAPAEHLRDKNGKPYAGVHFIESQKVPTETNYVYLQNNYWAEPSIAGLQKSMRDVFENAKAEKVLALETSKIIRKKFDWVEVCKPIKERLKEIYKKLK